MSKVKNIMNKLKRSCSFAIGENASSNRDHEFALRNSHFKVSESGEFELLIGDLDVRTQLSDIEIVCLWGIFSRLEKQLREHESRI